MIEKNSERIPVFCTQKRAERKLLMRVGEQGIWLWCRDHHMEEFIPWEDVPYAKEFFAKAGSVSTR